MMHGADLRSTLGDDERGRKREGVAPSGRNGGPGIAYIQKT